MPFPEPRTRRRRPRATKPAPVKALRQQGGHHEELHHAQAVSGIVKALVGLLQVLRVAKQPSPPQPASGAPEEEAQVLHQERRKRPRPRTLPDDPRKCAHAQDETRSQRRRAGRKRAEHGRENIKISLHMERLASLHDVGDACREHAD